ncbi:hypothetical protein ACE4Z5_26190, partial [Salmonella enterica]|uniref:hypothetical protein n=1 Tax=Salmonella enterica TaxID=28901 RepID=UPI003D2D86A1
LAYVWHVHRDYRPTRAWAAGAALAFAGTLPAMVADPPTLLEVAGDGLCFTGIVVNVGGIVRACGRRPPRIAGFLLAAAATMASGATFVA